MSANDKAKQKLMESMRMTKAGSDKKIEEVDTKIDIKPQNDKPVKKETNIPAATKAVKETKKLSVDPFQAARRVWPD